MRLNSDQGQTASVIVPTYNRCDRLARLLSSLERAYQVTPCFEVVVAVDGATDGTLEMLGALRTPYPLHVLRQPNSGPAAARNRAMGSATGDVLIFLDDDVTTTERVIQRHLAVHQRDPNGVVIGPMLAPPGRRMAPWLEWDADRLQRQYRAIIAGCYRPSPRQFYTANASVRRTHALAVGGFDECFVRAEDVEFAQRLQDYGLCFYFVPDAPVQHEPDRTYQSWLRVAYEYGRHVVREGPDRIKAAHRESGQRHPLNRLLATWCVGHPRYERLLVALLERFVTYAGPYAPKRLQIALCSPLFNIQFWQGVADATGLGANIWKHLATESVDTLGGRAAASTALD